MPEFIDPDELPFTRDEVFAAACRFMQVALASDLADHLAVCGPGIVATRADRRAAWRAAGVPNAESASLHAWVYPGELLPALASLSEEIGLRVHGLIEAAWALQEQGFLRAAQQRAAEAAGLIPTREQLRREFERGGRTRDILAIRLPALPPPTAQMRTAAAAMVAAKREQWNALVRQFQRDASPQ